MYNNKKAVKLRAVIIGTSVGTAVCALLMMLMTAIFLQMKSIPTGALPVAMQLLGAAGALTGGYVTVRITKCNGTVLGLLTALLMFIIITVVGMAVTKDTLTVNSITKCAAMLVAGCLGGILSVNKKQRVRIK